MLKNPRGQWRPLSLTVIPISEILKNAIETIL